MINIHEFLAQLRSRPAEQFISEAHRTRLQEKYGIEEARAAGLYTLSESQAREITGNNKIEGAALLIDYIASASNDNMEKKETTIRVRFDNPPLGDNGKEMRYWSPPGQNNALYIPVGVSLDSPLVVITEGEFKAIAGSQRGINVCAVSGIYNWKIRTIKGEKLDDAHGLLPELQRDWTGQRIALVYDSDITREHQHWRAFPRLAEQLYALGAYEVKVISLPVMQGGINVGGSYD